MKKKTNDTTSIALVVELMHISHAIVTDNIYIPQGLEPLVITYTNN